MVLVANSIQLHTRIHKLPLTVRRDLGRQDDRGASHDGDVFGYDATLQQALLLRGVAVVLRAEQALHVADGGVREDEICGRV